MNALDKGVRWIPDYVWIIVVYIMFITVGIYLGLGDGPECGVDYAPRFFGEC